MSFMAAEPALLTALVVLEKGFLIPPISAKVTRPNRSAWKRRPGPVGRPYVLATHLPKMPWTSLKVIGLAKIKKRITALMEATIFFCLDRQGQDIYCLLRFYSTDGS